MTWFGKEFNQGRFNISIQAKQAYANKLRIHYCISGTIKACLCGIRGFSGLEVGQISPGGLVRGGTETQKIRVRSERPDNSYLLRLTSPPTRLTKMTELCVCRSVVHGAMIQNFHFIIGDDKSPNGFSLLILVFKCPLSNPCTSECSAKHISSQNLKVRCFEALALTNTCCSVVAVEKQGWIDTDNNTEGIKVVKVT